MKMADVINFPVQVNGTTVPHLTNERSILSNHGLAIPPVSKKLTNCCFTPEPLVGLLKTSTVEEGKQLEPSVLNQL